jgi:hypothetical protein
MADKPLSHTIAYFSHSHRYGATACGPDPRTCTVSACYFGPIWPGVAPFGGSAPETLAGPGICDIRMSWRLSMGDWACTGTYAGVKASIWEAG